MQDFLLKYPKTLLIVSHAREFLNVVCTDVVHLHRCRFLPLPGDILLSPASHLITRTLCLRDGLCRQSGSQLLCVQSSQGV